MDHDYAEATGCLSSGAYKATILLAGSILEGLLIDHLNRHPGVRNADGWSHASLGKLIGACRERGLLTADSLQYAEVLRKNRNQIHPASAARSLSGAESLPARANAEAALRTLDVIGEELRRRSLGDVRHPNAHQVIDHLRRAPQDEGIRNLKIRRLPEKERETLLVDLLPSEALTEGAEYEAIATCFDATWGECSGDTKATMARKIFTVMTSGSSRSRWLYSVLFTRDECLQFLGDEDSARVLEGFWDARHTEGAGTLSAIWRTVFLAGPLTARAAIDALMDQFVEGEVPDLEDWIAPWDLDAVSADVRGAIEGRFEWWIDHLHDGGSEQLEFEVEVLLHEIRGRGEADT